MNEIFISYRRADSAANTGRLTSKLQEQFSPDAIFWDIPDIKVGDKYKNNIEQSLSSCKVLVVVIGPHWVGAKKDGNKEGRRLDDLDDVVRNECATALRRQVHVIPVLVDGAVMPSADQLPDDLKGLTDFNAAPFSERTWNEDFEALAAKLQHVTNLKRRTIEASRAALGELRELGSVIDRLYQTKSIAEQLHELYMNQDVRHVRSQFETLSVAILCIELKNAVRSCKTALDKIRGEIAEGKFLSDRERATEIEKLSSVDDAVKDLARIAEDGDQVNRSELKEVIGTFSYYVEDLRDSLNELADEAWSRLRLGEFPRTFERVKNQLAQAYSGYMDRIDQHYKELTGRPPFYKKCNPLAREHGILQKGIKDLTDLEQRLALRFDPNDFKRSCRRNRGTIKTTRERWEDFLRAGPDNAKDGWADMLLSTGKEDWESIDECLADIDEFLASQADLDSDSVLSKLRETREIMGGHFSDVDGALMRAFREVRNHLGGALRDIPEGNRS